MLRLQSLEVYDIPIVKTRIKFRVTNSIKRYHKHNTLYFSNMEPFLLYVDLQQKIVIAQLILNLSMVLLW